MTTLTGSTTFTIADTTTATETATVIVVPAPTAGNGKGRLVHPTYGAYDYTMAPDSWVNVDTDAVAAPIWESALTLTGGVNTLWYGILQGTRVKEYWPASENRASMPMEMIRQLLLFYANPPANPENYVQWWPNYATSQGFQVVLLGLEVGGEEITFGQFGRLWEYCNQPVALKMTIVARI